MGKTIDLSDLFLHCFGLKINDWEDQSIGPSRFLILFTCFLLLNNERNSNCVSMSNYLRVSLKKVGVFPLEARLQNLLLLQVSAISGHQYVLTLRRLLQSQLLKCQITSMTMQSMTMMIMMIIYEIYEKK